MRLRQLFTGEITHREMINLIKHLPRESALIRAMHGEIADWDVNTALMARAVNQLVIANGQRAGKRPDSGEFVKTPKDSADKSVPESRPSKSNKDAKLTREEFNALFD